MPRYWVQEFDTLTGQKSKPTSRSTTWRDVRLKPAWDKGWLLGWRDICRSTDERTVITSSIPRAAVGHKYPLILTQLRRRICSKRTCLASSSITWLRQKFAGTRLSIFVIKQLPVLPPYTRTSAMAGGQPIDWIRQRVLELSFTAWDMEAVRARSRRRRAAVPLGRGAPHSRCGPNWMLRTSICTGSSGMRWSTSWRRSRLSSERTSSGTGSFRTKELILDVYDAMAEAMRTGEPYQTILDPPPGHGPRHPARRNT